jgi:hypothetical protein
MKEIEQDFIIDRLTNSIFNDDILIQSPPLTCKERKELSEFIAKRKLEKKKKKIAKMKFWLKY